VHKRILSSSEPLPGSSVLSAADIISPVA
jgi:hypothetical protein